MGCSMKNHPALGISHENPHENPILISSSKESPHRTPGFSRTPGLSWLFDCLWRPLWGSATSTLRRHRTATFPFRNRWGNRWQHGEMGRKHLVIQHADGRSATIKHQNMAGLWLTPRAQQFPRCRWNWWFIDQRFSRKYSKTWCQLWSYPHDMHRWYPSYPSIPINSSNVVPQGSMSPVFVSLPYCLFDDVYPKHCLFLRPFPKMHWSHVNHMAWRGMTWHFIGSHGCSSLNRHPEKNMLKKGSLDPQSAIATCGKKTLYCSSFWCPKSSKIHLFFVPVLPATL